MKITFKPCVSDDEFAKVGLFFLEYKQDLYPTLSTLDTVDLLYTYITQGYLYQGVSSDNRTIAASAYFHGTPERSFSDKDVAFIDFAVMDKDYRGSKLFARGLTSLVNWIHEAHPEVEELQFIARSENTYLCKMYAKFMTLHSTREEPIGEVAVFRGKIIQIRDILRKFDRV